MLNGYPVLASHPRSDMEAHRVICFRQGDPAPFVVATWSPHNANEWSWGHYFEDLWQAVDYYKRCNEGRIT